MLYFLEDFIDHTIDIVPQKNVLAIIRQPEKFRRVYQKVDLVDSNQRLSRLNATIVIIYVCIQYSVVDDRRWLGEMKEIE